MANNQEELFKLNAIIKKINTYVNSKKKLSDEEIEEFKNDLNYFKSYDNNDNRFNKLKLTIAKTFEKENEPIFKILLDMGLDDGDVQEFKSLIK